MALGQPVHVLGSADMQILPMPRLHFESVHVGPDEQNPILTVDKFDIGVELFPLVQGKIDVVDMTLKNPSLKLEVDEKGRFGWRQDGGKLWDLDMEKIRLNDVRIEHGRIDFLDKRTGRSKQLTDLNGGVEARTLVGPYKIDAAFQMDGNPYSLMLSTGTASADGMRVKSLLTPANFPVSLAMDGNVAEGGDELFHYIGTTNISNDVEGANVADTPWSLSGQSDLTVSSLVMPKFEFSHGPVEHAYRLNGAGTIDFGKTPRFDVVVSSRQLDFDRALGNGPNAPINLQDGLEKLADALAVMPLPSIPGHIGFDVPGVILAGGVIRNLQLDADLVGSDWKVQELTADLPGQTIVSLSGLFSRKLDGDSERHGFEGQARIRSDQPAAFSKWWLNDAPTNGQLRPFDLSGQLFVRSDHIQVSDLDLSMEGDRATGYIDWYAGKQDGKDSEGDALSINLDAERIDLDAVMGIGSLLLSNSTGKAAPLRDIALDIKTDRLTTGAFEGYDLSTKMRLAKGGIEIDHLSVDDFAGATISAQGLLQDISGVPNGQIEGKISADDLEGLSALVGRLLPGSSVSKWFASKQAMLSPTDLSFSIKGGDADHGLTSSMRGMLGGGNATLNASLDGTLETWKDGNLDLTFDLDNPNGQKLLALMGAEGGFVDLPELSLSTSLKGTLSKGADIDVEVKAADGSVAYQGKIKSSGDDDITTDGKISLKASDLAPYLMSAGISLSNPGETLPVAVMADLVVDKDLVAIKALEGQWNDQPVTADLSFDRRSNNRLLKGTVDFGDMDGIWLGETILGPGRLTSVDRNWPDLAFVAPTDEGSKSPLKVDLSVKARSLELAAPYIFQQPNFSLIWQNDKLSIQKFKALLHGGQVEGGLDLDNVDGEAVLKSHLRVGGAALEPFIWERDGRSVAKGLVDVNLDVESQGRSLAGVMSGLSGTGTFALHDATLNYINPSAFAQVVRAVDAGMELKDDDIKKAFVSHMDAGSTEVSLMEGTFVIAGGALRANNIETDAEILKSRGNLVLDLSNQTIDGDWSIKVEPAKEDAVTGAQPEVGLAFSGPLDAPERVVDVAPFTGYLTIRAFEREVDRVERLQADILEKDRMRRLLRLYREKAKHREDERVAKEKAAAEVQKAAEEQAQQAKAKELERQKAIEAERTRKAAEEEARRKAEKARLAAEQKVKEAAAPSERATVEAEKETAAKREASRLQEEAKRAEAEAKLIEALRKQQTPLPDPAGSQSDSSSGDIIMRPLEDLKRSSTQSDSIGDQPSEPALVDPEETSIQLPEKLLKLPRDRVVPSLNQGFLFPFTDQDMSSDYIIQNY